MKPHELIAALLAKEKLPELALAKRMKKPWLQPSINRFLNGKVESPERSTSVPLAAYFNLPVDAIYDSKLATSIARERGVTALPPRPVTARKKAPDKVADIDLAPEELEMVLAHREKLKRAAATAPVETPQFVDRPAKRRNA